MKLDRSFFSTVSGSYVTHLGDTYRITQTIDLKTVIGVNVLSGKAESLSVDELKPLDSKVPDNGFIHSDTEDFVDSDWKEIERRFGIIKPLINGATKVEVQACAKQAGIHYTTLYRWLKNYINTGNLIGLLPKKRGSEVGSTRIDEAAEEVIRQAIDDHYLTKQRPVIQHVIEIIHQKCRKLNIQKPSKNTIRSRISKISEYDRIKKQGMRSAASTLYDPVPGKYNADYPLHVVQIDHTKMDIILVDDEARLPIGRPWITLAIDIYSRMVVGYYLSLDAPSQASIAMCIAHSINPKDNWLLDRGIDARWPVWGVMTSVHSDNGADFRSESLRKSCLPYEIQLVLRPVKKTHYGGHIERLLGTVLKRVHALPGTTFSSIKDRLEYDSDKNAVMSFSEFEQWLVIYIAKFYHNNRHATLGVSPLKKWEMGMLGDGRLTGNGYPPKPTDSETILIDFLPIFERTVQKTGVNIEGLNYYDNVLRQYINVKDEKTGKGKKHIFRRDPRDITSIWFYDRVTQHYFKIPVANQNLHGLNLWEFRAAKAFLKKQNRRMDNDHILLDTLEEMRELVDISTKATKKTRRKKQQKKEHKKTLDYNYSSTHSPQSEEPNNTDDDWIDGEVLPY